MNWENLLNEFCPACDEDLERIEHGFKCPVCGFFITSHKMRHLQDRLEDERIYAECYLRGEHSPDIDTEAPHDGN